MTGHSDRFSHTRMKCQPWKLLSKYVPYVDRASTNFISRTHPHQHYTHYTPLSSRQPLHFYDGQLFGIWMRTFTPLIGCFRS